MIDGLKVCVTGEELKQLLGERAAGRRALAAHWERERQRTSDDETEDAPLLPDHICRNEAAQEEWRAGVFTLLRDRLDIAEIYRLGLDDLEYIELLPAKPELYGPEEYEDPTSDQRDLGPYAQRICDSPEIVLITNPDVPGE